MNKRLKLHNTLCDILESKHVYFQPPESVKMKYPAIVYTLNGLRDRYADNKIYNRKNEYQITVIDEEPDSVIAEKISKLPYCIFNRHYSVDNLNHYVFVINY